MDTSDRPTEPADESTPPSPPSPPAPPSQPEPPAAAALPEPVAEAPPAYPTYASQYGSDPSVAIVPVVPYTPADPQSPFTYAPPPPPPPKPLGPPKSVLGATLLNLTGLGLGYAYLRDRVLFVVALALTSGMVTVAFLTGAAQQPWLWRGVILGWLVLLASHALLLARRREPGPRRVGPIIVGAAAVAALAAGYVGYGIAGGSVYADGVAAQEKGDCATATGAFDTVTGPFELTLRSDVLDAADRRAECVAYDAALAAQKRGDHEQAITLYHDFDKIHPGSVLGSFVHTNLADTYFASATDWAEPLTAQAARASVDTLLMLRREYADTAVVKKVPEAIATAFASATKPYADGKFCDALPVLDYFSGLDVSSAGEVVPTAVANRGRALYECGMSQLRGNAAAEAATTLQQFVTGYPKDGAIPQARAALITAKVATAAGVQLPVPPPLGDNNPGSISVTFYNDSSEPLTILVAGPTAHELTLPGCAVCPADYAVGSPAACATFDGRPAVTMRLTPAQYHFTTVRTSSVNSYTDSVTPLVGYEHTQCLYVEQI